MKWLPWNIGTQVTVVIIPIVALTAMILYLNVVAPSSADVRVIKYVINVVPQVRGRVIEVPVEPNRLVRKGDILFKIDPTPYELTVKALEAQLANISASARELDEQVVQATGKIAETRGAIEQAQAKEREVIVRIDLAKRRVAQNRELVTTGAGDRFALEKAETDLADLEAQLATGACDGRAVARDGVAGAGRRAADSPAPERARARTSTRRSRRSARSSRTRAGSWRRRRSTPRPTATRSTCSCGPARSPAAFPITPALTFVENTYQVIGLFGQNELHQVDPGQRGRVHDPDRTRAASSRRRSTRSCGRRGRAR
jgi:multidrug resistance efflux pump